MIFFLMPLLAWLLMSAGSAPVTTQQSSPPLEEAFLEMSITSNTTEMTRCNDRRLSDIADKLLKALNLERTPKMNTEKAARLRAMWKVQLNSASQNSRNSGGASLAEQKRRQESITSGNETSLSNNYRGNKTRTCCQVTSEIFIQDLGWQSWIIYPESFSYSECVDCTTALSTAPLQCRQELLSADISMKEYCCKAKNEILVPFVYLEEDSSLVIRNVPFIQECECQV
ncbi:bone morphogenetic protein 6-like [Protopterus annectens]|uniref:bone morphogenetic protein 6-like n=1 Tax=Protopterus annectens TaxID=7888 RepID=UPI001CFBD65B|nr:bone morphogenetic protein 6-like [Protopterus annectens]